MEQVSDNLLHAGGVKMPPPPEVTITVDYQLADKHGRMGKVFRIFDGAGGQVRLAQKHAIKAAKVILKIAKEERKE